MGDLTVGIRCPDVPSDAGRAVAELATRQHGVVSVAQLRRIGLDSSAVARRAAAGRLHSIHRGVYAVGHRSITRRGQYLAAVLACGPEAALSHRSAADLWGLRRDSTCIEVTAPRRRAGLPGIVVHRSRLADPADFDSIDGIRVTSVARTLLDLAVVVTARELARAVDRAERLELFDLISVEDLLNRASRRAGRRSLRNAIEGWQPSYTRSELEDRFQELVRRAKLPPPQINVLLRGERAAHEVDCFWPSRRLVVQLDGFAYHRTRRDRERDSTTDADLELAGFRVLRLTWDDVAVHGYRTVRRLRQALSSPPMATASAWGHPNVRPDDEVRDAAPPVPWDRGRRTRGKRARAT